MLILLTGAAHPLGRSAAGVLAQDGHTVRATDSVPQPESNPYPEYHRGDLTDPTFVAPLLEGVEAIVHLAPLSPIEPLAAEAVGEAQPEPAAAYRHARSPGETLDAAARGTHVLLKAAVEVAAGTGAPPVVVQGSTLAVMDAYEDSLEVTEQWRPRPRPVAEHLAPYLAELTAREFTRDVQLDPPLRIVCLRFAPWGTGRDDLTLDDASRAIVRALAVLQEGARQRGHRWHLYHIASPSPEARYTSAAAQRAIGYASGSTA